MDLILDTSWIDNFNKYETFYKENINDIQIYFFYINRKNKLIKIKKTIYELKKTNILSKEELIYLIQKHKQIENTKYSLLSLLQYNFDIEPNDIITHKLERNNITTNTNTNTMTNINLQNYLKPLHSLDSIYWNATINFFRDINSLYIVFYEKKNTQTKDNNTLSNKQNKTKRVYISTTKKNQQYKKHKYTRRK